MPHLSRLFVIPVLLVVGCAPQNDGPTDSGSQTAAPTDDQSQTVEEQPPVELVIADWDALQAWVADQEGKVVVVDLWSTWCQPCLRELPHLAELQKQHPDAVACASFNLNYEGLPNKPPESSREVVLEALTGFGANLHNVMSNENSDEIYQRLMLASIPAVYVYDQTGELKKRFDNEQLDDTTDEFTYKQDIIPLVEQLLSQQP